MHNTNRNLFQSFIQQKVYFFCIIYQLGSSDTGKYLFGVLYFKYIKNCTMDRKNFLNSITGGLALSCVSCMMAACSKEENNGGATGNGNGNANLTIDLATQITAIGDFLASNGFIVIRVASGNQVSSFKAFSNICPHQGGIISYDKASSAFSCATHGATFNQTGTVTKGPASTNMTTIIVSITGNILTIQG